jgi:hypothetical protein
VIAPGEPSRVSGRVHRRRDRFSHRNGGCLADFCKGDEMSIRFQTTIDHLIAFNRFHLENSPAWRGQQFIQSTLWSILVLSWSVLLFVTVVPRQVVVDNHVLTIVLIVTCLGLAIGTFFFIRWRMTANSEWIMRKLLAEGSNRTILGWCEVSLTGNRLFVKRELLDGSFELRAIEKVATTDDYAFVYVSSVSAVVIPLRLFPEDEYRDFVNELLEAWRNREALRSLDVTDDRIQLAKTS